MTTEPITVSYRTKCKDYALGAALAMFMTTTICSLLLIGELKGGIQFPHYITTVLEFGTLYFSIAGIVAFASAYLWPIKFHNLLERPDRGQMQLVDVAMMTFILIGLIVLAPIFYTFIGMIDDSADPFSSLILKLVVPTLIILLIISVGLQSRRNTT